MTALAVVEKFLTTFSIGDLDGCLELLDENVTVLRNGQWPMSRDQYRDLGAMFLSGYSAMHFELVRSVEASDTVATSYNVHMKHTGNFQGIPATGKAIVCLVTTFDRVVNDKIVDRIEVSDDLGMLTQLGAIPAAAAA